jgi:hypothetical protein
VWALAQKQRAALSCRSACPHPRKQLARQAGALEEAHGVGARDAPVVVCSAAERAQLAPLGRTLRPAALHNTRLSPQ